MIICYSVTIIKAEFHLFWESMDEHEESVVKTAKTISQSE